MVADTYLLGIQEVEAGTSRAQIHPQLQEDFKINRATGDPVSKHKDTPPQKKS